MAPAQHTDTPFPARVPDGTRVYAIGDVHGRADLLEDLIGRIAGDGADGPRRRVLVFLGDVIDRGPATKPVIDFLLHGLPDGFANVFLKGNHEDMLVRLLAGEPGLAPSWLVNGGVQTLKSYGLAPPRWDGGEAAFAHLRHALTAALPKDHLAFLAELKTRHREGDYLFVHAGVRPGVAPGGQSDHDLMWIREGFLDHDGPFEDTRCVVHGHTIAEAPDIHDHRIGIDTGAYASGRLTCLVLEGTDRRFLATGER